MGKQYRTNPWNIATLPPGVPYIIANEAAERFSFYGTKSILAIFMTQYLVTQSGLTDHMSNSEAQGYSHLFVFGVYMTPIFGAILSDWLLGKYRTILYLSIIYCLGHFTLAINDTRLGLVFGLSLIAIGAGGIKPCVSANVGDQFGESNKHLLSRVFGWFYFAINIGSSLSVVACPFLLADPRFGPRWAFGVPGVAMAIATLVFWLGRNKVVHVPPGGLKYFKELFSREGLKVLGRLALIYIFIGVFWALWDQSNGVEWTLQAAKMDLRFLGLTLQPAQVQVANPILILLFIPFVNYVLYPRLDKVFPLTPLRKIGIGLFLTALSFVVIVYIQNRIDQGFKPTVYWQFLAYVILTLGETMVSITGLEFSYTQAPNRMKSAVMGLWLFSTSLGNLFDAKFNFWNLRSDGSRKLDDLQFFAFFAALMFITACIFVLVARFYRGKTYLQPQEDRNDPMLLPALEIN